MAEHGDAHREGDLGAPRDPDPADVTRLLRRADAGHPPEELLPLVYAQLRAIADRRMARERPGHTLTATALVHEAYLRLLGPPSADEPVHWDGRGHFFAAAAESMRRILVESARRRASARRGGGWARVPLDVVDLATEQEPAEILALDEALERMEEIDGRMHRVVMLRFFAGLGNEETAEVLGVSPRTVKREWTCARAWLFDALRDREEEDAP